MGIHDHLVAIARLEVRAILVGIEERGPDTADEERNETAGEQRIAVTQHGQHPNRFSLAKRGPVVWRMSTMV